MKLTWLGHSGFRIEIADQMLLVDPWLTGNPMFPQDKRGRGDPGRDGGSRQPRARRPRRPTRRPSPKELGIPAVGTYDLMSWWEQSHGIATVGFNKGGTIRLGDVARDAGQRRALVLGGRRERADLRRARGRAS